MTAPIRHLPVVQNWDCHVSGNCCKEYQVPVTEEERQRVEKQGWAEREEFRGLPLFRRAGGQTFLNHHPDGSCVFLGPTGRCRIHEEFGFAAKPLPCRLFPFILVPVGDHYRVGVRFACPSAARNQGKAVSGHDSDLKEFAGLLETREGVAQKGGPRAVPAPRLYGRQRLEWPDLLRLVDVFTKIVRERQIPMERRLRKCLALANLCRVARWEALQEKRLEEFLSIVVSGLDAEVPSDPTTLPRPGWTGRILFRQALALMTRKDRGPNRGPATQGRVSLLQAAWRFAQGRGAVPRLHAWVPEMTFEGAEKPCGALPGDAEAVLERYYLIKLGSVQFCGVTNFGMSVLDGLESLLLTYPALLWLRRGYTDLPPGEAIIRALSIIDDNFGYHPVLGSARQQFAFRILSRTHELERLIAWYSL